MPELPDITVYVEAVAARTRGSRLEKVRIANPFLLRSVDPPLAETFGKRVEDVSRIGKRIVLGLEQDLYLVLHLMIAGRLHWTDRGAKPYGRKALAAFDFETGSLALTEAGARSTAHRICLNTPGLDWSICRPEGTISTGQSERATTVAVTEPIGRVGRSAPAAPITITSAWTDRANRRIWVPGSPCLTAAPVWTFSGSIVISACRSAFIRSPRSSAPRLSGGTSPPVTTT